MIWHIVRKEIMDNFLSLRFMLSLILIISLFVASSFIFVGNSRGSFDWHTISKKPVNFNIVPKFQERDLALGQSLKLAIWDIGLLVLFNLVFFAASYVSFLRYDVR